jgi:hypothetical protein
VVVQADGEGDQALAGVSAQRAAPMFSRVSRHICAGSSPQ